MILSMRGTLLYGEPNAISNAIGYAKHRSRSHDALIRVYDEAVNVIDTHEQACEFKDRFACLTSAVPTVQDIQMLKQTR
jgi:hypothetical protein